MVFGDVNKERLQLNEKTLWSGSPDDNNNPEAVKSLDKIRQLLFGKVSLNQSGNAPDTIPTEMRLKNPDDFRLQETYFQFGRYLLISSSRKGSLPANLQGIWEKL